MAFSVEAEAYSLGFGATVRFYTCLHILDAILAEGVQVFWDALFPN